MILPPPPPPPPHSPLIHKIFRYQKFCETQKGSSTKWFGTVRQKIFDGNLWYPLLCIEFFDTPNFLRQWRDAHEIVRHCETKNFRRKNVIPPFSSIKLFETRSFLKNSRIPLRNFSALWDIKTSTENRDMPPLIHNFFRYQKFSGKQKAFFTKLFISVLWDKKYQQNRDAPSYAWKFSIKEFFWNTKVFLFSNEIFRYSETKTSTENRDTPPPLIQTFSIPEISEILKGPPTKFFGTVRQKIFDRKSWNSPPPPLIHKLFSCRKFSETQHRRIHLPNFSALWDKKISTQNRKSWHNPLKHKIFWYPKLMKH